VADQARERSVGRAEQALGDVRVESDEEADGPADGRRRDDGAGAVGVMVASE
jgi:hypothetical protein